VIFGYDSMNLAHTTDQTARPTPQIPCLSPAFMSSSTIQESNMKGSSMKTQFLMSVICFVSLAMLAAEQTDFSGTWEFNTEKSQNIGMMAQMKMSATVQQTDSALDITTHSIYQGKDRESTTHLDLTGSPATNESPMGGPNETVSKWDGNKLVTTWTGESAVAGKKVVRTETRSLSPDGKVMTVESVRAPNPPIVMVFEKK
jgi:hypothetical protein